VLGHSGCRLVFVEDAEQAAKLARVRGGLPELRNVVVLDGEVEGAITLDELRRTGKARGTVDGVAADPEDPATIVYTSGTTGLPKGCVLSHANLLAVVEGSIQRLELDVAPPVIYLYLPLAHVLARVSALVAMATSGRSFAARSAPATGSRGAGARAAAPPWSIACATASPTAWCWRRSARRSARGIRSC